MFGERLLHHYGKSGNVGWQLTFRQEMSLAQHKWREEIVTQTSRFLLGMGQMLVVGGAVKENLARAVEMIERAAEQGCQVIVLPECLDIGWTHPKAEELAQPIPGPHSDVLCGAAQRCRIHVVAGLTERERDKVYNSAILVSPEGDILIKHRKINVLTIAQDLYEIGDSLSVASTSLGKIGIDICADNFPNSLALGHSLARMGAQLILSPCAWAVDANHDNAVDPYGGMWKKAYTTLARLYDVSVVGVSNVGWINGGVWKGRKCIGCSMAVGPGGKVLAEAPYGVGAEALIAVNIEVLVPNVKGTAIASMLRDKGYDGP